MCRSRLVNGWREDDRPGCTSITERSWASLLELHFTFHDTQYPNSKNLVLDRIVSSSALMG